MSFYLSLCLLIINNLCTCRSRVYAKILLPGHLENMLHCTIFYRDDISNRRLPPVEQGEGGNIMKTREYIRMAFKASFKRVMICIIIIIYKNKTCFRVMYEHATMCDISPNFELRHTDGVLEKLRLCELTAVTKTRLKFSFFVVQ